MLGISLQGDSTYLAGWVVRVIDRDGPNAIGGGSIAIQANCLDIEARRQTSMARIWP